MGRVPGCIKSKSGNRVHSGYCHDQNEGENDEIAALERGASDFVAKPYKAKVILRRVASIIHLRENATMLNLFQKDRTTGLLSKEYFCQQAEKILRSNPDKTYDIICSDVENFKLINDAFGMQGGNKVLKTMGGSVRSPRIP